MRERLDPSRAMFLIRQRWPDACDLARFVRRRVVEERLQQLAGSLTFTTLLGLVPTLTIALAIFTYFPQFGTLKATLETYFTQSMIPKGIANTILGYLTSFASKAARVSAFGGLAALIAASLTIRIVEGAFNQVWRVKTQRTLGRRLTLYVGIAALGPFLLGVSLSLSTHLYSLTSGFFGKLPFFSPFLFELFSILWMTAVFTLLYRVVPHRIVAWRDALAGGFAAAVAFEIVKRLFAAFIIQFSSYRAIYGALAAIPVFMVWIYMSWLITLVGALVASIVPLVKHGRWKHKPYPGSLFADAMRVLEALFFARVAATSSVEEKKLPLLTQLGADEIERLLETMQSAGWVRHIKADIPIRVRRWNRIRKGRGERWVLVADPTKLTLADVYRLFVFEGSGKDGLTIKVEAAIEEGLKESLSDYFLKS